MRVSKANHADRADKADVASRANALVDDDYAGGWVIARGMSAADIRKRFEKLEDRRKSFETDLGFIRDAAALGEIPHLKDKIAALEEILGIEWKEGGRYEGVEE